MTDTSIALFRRLFPNVDPRSQQPTPAQVERAKTAINLLSRLYAFLSSLPTMGSRRR